MTINRIGIQEIIVAIEAENVGRLSACWLVFAAAQGEAQWPQPEAGQWANVRRRAQELGVPKHALDAVERHVAALPANQRGFVEVS